MSAKSKDHSPFSSKKNAIVRSFIPTEKNFKEIKNYKNENDISLCILYFGCKYKYNSRRHRTQQIFLDCTIQYKNYGMHGPD